MPSSQNSTPPLSEYPQLLPRASTILLLHHEDQFPKPDCLPVMKAWLCLKKRRRLRIIEKKGKLNVLQSNNNEKK